VEVSVDVVDVGLDVCSPDLLVEFRENFDFDEVRDYVRAKLDGGEAELLGNRMFAHFVDTAAGEFAACVDGWAGYCRASRDVRDGWLEPVLPARVARIAGRVGRAVGKGILVLGDGSVELDATADVVECTLGSGVVVETGGRVVRSVVGDGCRIGAGAVVEDCIVGAGVVVEAAAKVSAGLLLDGVFLASEVCIPAYCFLGTNVRVGRGGGAEAGMKPGTWVGEAPRAGQREAGEEGDGTKTESESDESLSIDGDNGYVGSGGSAVSSEMLGDDGSGKLLPDRRRCQYYLEQSGVKRGHIFAGWPGFLEDCQSDSEDELEGEAGKEMEGSADDSAGDFDDSEEHWEGRKMAKFYAEIVETVEHGISEAADVDTIALEVNSLKLGYELMYCHARIGVVRALAAMVQKHNVGTSPKVLFAAVKAIFARWSELVSKFSNGDNAVTQRSLVDELAAFLADNGLLLHYVLRTLYDRDILEEDAILGWANTERRAAMDRPLPQVLKQVLPFIVWLEEADEEDESDDEKDFASLCVKSE
jgi:translation initiation factor eIF-2B subunit epsilon